MTLHYAQYAMTAVLLLAMFMEMKTGRIPNWLVLLPIVIFAGYAIARGDLSAIYWPVGLAVAVFIGGLGLFAVGGIGAGAVKLLAGTALFIPKDQALWALGLFFAAFFVWAIIIVQLRKLLGSDDHSWHVMAKAVIPMSVPISAAALACFYLI